MTTTLPRVEVTGAEVADLAVDALVVPVFRGAIEGPGAESVLQALELDGVPRDATFTGRAGELLTLAAPGLAAGRVVLAGLGRMDELSDEQLRRAAGAAAGGLRTSVASMATTLALDKPSPDAVRAVAEGALLGSYRYDDQRSEPEARTLEAITIAVPSSLEDQARGLLDRARLHARAQVLARDLVNTPPGQKTPARLADRAREALEPTLDVEVWDEDRLARERCEGILAVGRGSTSPPRLLVARHGVREEVREALREVAR